MLCFHRAWNELGHLHVKRDLLYEKIMIQNPLRNELISYLEVPLYRHQFFGSCEDMSK